MSNTSENNKRIAKNTLLLYFRMLFTMAVALYTSRVVLNTLGVEDYGIYNVVGGVIAMFGFLNAAMSASTSRYITFELGNGDPGRLKKIFSLSISIHALISLIIIVAGEIIGLWFLYTQMKIPEARMDAAFWVFQFSVASTVLMIMSVPYNAAIIAHEKMSAFAYISIMDVVLKLLIVYLLVIIPFDKLKIYAFLIFCVQLLDRLIYGWYCTKHFKEAKFSFIWDKQLFKEMTGFAGWNLFGNIAGIAFTQGLNLLLNVFFGPVVNAARGVSVQVQGAINGFSSNFQTALNPQITKSYATHELSRMHSLIYASSKYSFFLLFFLSLPILIETNQILIWWLKVVPDHTVSFLRIMMCTSMIDAMSNPLIAAAGATGKIKIYQIVVGGILLLILPLSYIALKLGFPPESVFAVHLAMVVVAQAARLWMIRPMILLPIRKYLKEVVSRAIAVAAFSLILPLLSFAFLPETVYRFFTICLICMFSTGLFIYLLGLKNSEKEFVINKVSSLLQKIRR